MAYETEDHETQYCFPVINSSCIKGRRSKYEYNIMYVFVSLLSAWTVFLNLLVIISISHFKKLHTPTNMLILSLAVTDLLVGLFVIPVEGIKIIETCWYFGHNFCGIFILTIALLFSASLSNLVCIAVDRFIAVCYPLLYPQTITMTKTILIICLCWFCSLTYNITIVISNGYFDKLNKTDICYGQCSIVANFAWRVTDLFLSFMFPCIGIITLYLRVFYIVHQQVKVINSLVKFGKCVTESSVRRKSESKAALTLGIIVIIYLLCWIPYYILSVTYDATNAFTIVNFLTWTLYVNSGLNPLIYALFYSWFKLSVKYILTLRIFQPSSSLLDIFTDIA
ncbi:trace amine-associated receptor 13c-like [Myxocyprinus asiaticus]|uniref:trace amine-associated receptor 13c-like n=1 Tax=Myxocyprinus asiaticus TaxID=70543 RepID=UPI0022228D28|nr:trace amine-associated receptor 13c-like [Myxocyprinus asiaticus]